MNLEISKYPGINHSVDENEDFVESHLDQHLPATANESNATQWLSDQFNPISLELRSGNRGNPISVPNS